MLTHCFGAYDKIKNGGGSIFQRKPGHLKVSRKQTERRRDQFPIIPLCMRGAYTVPLNYTPSAQPKSLKEVDSAEGKTKQGKELQSGCGTVSIWIWDRKAVGSHC